MIDQPTLELPPAAPPPRVARASLTLVAGLIVASLIGSAFSPVLLVKYPLLLVALSPDGRHIALAVGSVAPIPLVMVAVLRRVLFSTASFGIGVAYGAAAVTWVERRSPRLGAAFRFLERCFARFGVAILVLLPFGSVSVLAGAARTPLVTYLVAVLVGHTLWVGGIYLIGELIADFTEQVLAFLSSHLVESTVVCVILVLIQQIVSRRRAARRPGPREPSP